MHVSAGLGLYEDGLVARCIYPLGLGSYGESFIARCIYPQAYGEGYDTECMYPQDWSSDCLLHVPQALGYMEKVVSLDACIFQLNL